MKTPSSGYTDTQAWFGSISLVAKKLTSLSKVSSSLEEDAPGLLPAHPVGTRVLVLKHLSADKRVVEGEAFAKPERYALTPPTATGCARYSRPQRLPYGFSRSSPAA